jgi:hypothetical protein
MLEPGALAAAMQGGYRRHPTRTNVFIPRSRKDRIVKDESQQTFVAPSGAALVRENAFDHPTIEQVLEDVQPGSLTSEEHYLGLPPFLRPNAEASSRQKGDDRPLSQASSEYSRDAEDRSKTPLSNARANMGSTAARFIDSVNERISKPRRGEGRANSSSPVDYNADAELSDEKGTQSHLTGSNADGSAHEGCGGQGSAGSQKTGSANGSGVPSTVGLDQLTTPDLSSVPSGMFPSLTRSRTW